MDAAKRQFSEISIQTKIILFGISILVALAVGPCSIGMFLGLCGAGVVASICDDTFSSKILLNSPKLRLQLALIWYLAWLVYLSAYCVNAGWASAFALFPMTFIGWPFLTWKHKVVREVFSEHWKELLGWPLLGAIMSVAMNLFTMNFGQLGLDGWVLLLLPETLVAFCLIFSIILTWRLQGPPVDDEAMSFE